MAESLTALACHTTRLQWPGSALKAPNLRTVVEQASLARCHVSPSPTETASHRVCSNFSAFLCAPELRCLRRPPKDGSSESSVAVPNHRPERSSTGHLEPAGTRQETAEAPQPRTSKSSRHVPTEREELLFFTSLQATSYTPKPLHIPLPMFRPLYRDVKLVSNVFSTYCSAE